MPSPGGRCTTSSRTRRSSSPQLAFPLFFFAAFAGGLSRIHDVPGFNFPENYTSFQFVFVLLQSRRVRRRLHRLRHRARLRGRLRQAAAARGAAPHRDRAGLRRRGTRALARHRRLPHRGRVRGRHQGGRQRRRPRRRSTCLAAILNTAALFWACGVAMRLRTMQAGPAMQMPVFLVLVLRAGLRAAEPAEGLDPRRRGRQPGDPHPRSRPQASSPARRPQVAAAFGAAVALSALFSLWAMRGLRKAEAAG